jgi:hypothetical protein
LSSLVHNHNGTKYWLFGKPPGPCVTIKLENKIASKKADYNRVTPCPGLKTRPLFRFYPADLVTFDANGIIAVSQTFETL